MTEVSFYHLQRSPLEVVLPKLLEKTLAAGKRAVVMASSEDRVESLNAILWSQDPGGWLPHGSAADGFAEHQPVWLTAALENPNRADFLFLTDGAAVEDLSGYERCFDLFDGNDDTAVQAARGRWKSLTAAGHALTYWQQNVSGAWEEKAGA